MTVTLGCDDTKPAVTPPLLERTVAVVPGDACASGGTEILTGRDDNANGVLDDAEVERTDLVCNAAVPNTLAHVLVEPAGARCPAGGHVVQSGPDRDRNGVLDDDEIERTDVVCNGAPPATLTRVDDEPAGAHCASGGRAVRSGPDRNGNGTLDDDEVATTAFVCSVEELFEGDFTRDMWQDPVAVAALQDVRAITGSLTIDSDAPVSLPHLTLVGGSLTLIKAGNPTQLGVPALAAVGADVVAGGAGFTGELRLPALKQVGGNFIVEQLDMPGAGAPHAVSAPALIVVARTLRIALLAAQELSLPALQTVGGELQLESLELPAVELPALVIAGIEMVDVGQAIELPALQNAGELLVAGGNVHTLHAPALTVAGLVIVSQLPELAQLSLPALRQVGLGLLVMQCARLATLELPRLVSIGETATVFRSSPVLALQQLPALESVTLPQLRFLVDQVSVLATGLQSLSFPALENATVIDLRDSPVAALSLGAVTELQRFEAHHTQLADLRSLQAVTALGGLELDANPVLGSLAGVERLTSIRDDLTLTGNAALVSLSALDHLATVFGAVTITDNPLLSAEEIAALIARVHHP